MDFYEKKRKLRLDIKNWLENLASNATNPEPKEISDFVKKCALESGFSEKTIRLEFRVFKVSIENDKLTSL